MGAWTAFVATFVAEALLAVSGNHAWLVARLPDDGFYYLEIAERLSRGEGFTFDGINATNGFHLLWQAMLVPLAVAFDGDTLVRSTVLLGIGVSCAALLLIVRLAARVVGQLPAS